MNDAYTHPKRTAEQINIWYTAFDQSWNTCALLPFRADYYGKEKTLYHREREKHPTFSLALKFIQDNYVGGTK